MANIYGDISKINGLRIKDETAREMAKLYYHNISIIAHVPDLDLEYRIPFPIVTRDYHAFTDFSDLRRYLDEYSFIVFDYYNGVLKTAHFEANQLYIEDGNDTYYEDYEIIDDVLSE